MTENVKKGWVYYEGPIPEDIFRIVELRKEFELLRIIQEEVGVCNYRTGSDPSSGARLIESNNCTILNKVSEDGVTSRRLDSYDAVRHLVNAIMLESTWPGDYRGMPMLPEAPSSFEFMQLYRDADAQDEKGMIFYHVLSMYIESLRHMRPLLDILYGKDGWNRFWYC